VWGTARSWPWPTAAPEGEHQRDQQHSWVGCGCLDVHAQPTRELIGCWAQVLLPAPRCLQLRDAAVAEEISENVLSGSRYCATRPPLGPGTGCSLLGCSLSASQSTASRSRLSPLPKRVPVGVYGSLAVLLRDIREQSQSAAPCSVHHRHHVTVPSCGILRLQMNMR
jgi:hypothetical protein